MAPAEMNGCRSRFWPSFNFQTSLFFRQRIFHQLPLAGAVVKIFPLAKESGCRLQRQGQLLEFAARASEKRTSGGRS